MGILHIKKLLLPKVNSHYQVVLVDCQGGEDCGDDPYNVLPPPSPPPPPPPYFDGEYESKSNVLISSNLLILFCCLAAFVILICVLIILRKYRLNRRRTNSPNLDQTHEEFINEDHGPELIHPIWFINTIGLQQSVIDSIAIFKYKKDEVLIEGTDCSVCLSEFQEDESLRLLPNCSHAFHIPCIDTWLRSHKNCPLCRGPVVVDTNNVDVSTLERNSNGLSSMEDNLVDNVELGSDRVREDGEYIGAFEQGNVSDNLDRSSPVVVDTNNVDVITLERNSNGLSSTEDNLVDNVENNVELGSDQVREDGENIGALAMPIEQGNVSDNLDRSSRYFSARDFYVRVQSDLADHIVKMEGELQQRRRSISMDSSSASMIHFAAANIRSIADGSYLTRADSSKVARKGKLSSSRIFGVMESCSFRRYSGKRPISMKRSFSTSGKWSKQSSSRSQDSILPFSDSIVTSKF